MKKYYDLFKKKQLVSNLGDFLILSEILVSVQQLKEGEIEWLFDIAVDKEDYEISKEDYDLLCKEEKGFKLRTVSLKKYNKMRRTELLKFLIDLNKKKNVKRND